MKIYLVLQHVGGGNGRCGDQVFHQYKPFGPTHESEFGGIGGNGHDASCHCLIIHRTTYTTRREADEAAKKLMGEHPGDCCFSLEVHAPEAVS